MIRFEGSGLGALCAKDVSECGTSVKAMGYGFEGVSICENGLFGP